MWVIAWSLVVVSWFAWLYPFLFRAPHRQNRASITAAGPTRLGLLLQGVAIFLAFVFHRPIESDPGLARLAAAIPVAALSAAMGWKSVANLGRQFRVHAGLYHDHQLVRTGPYGIVRHPIYASLLGMLIATLALISELRWAALPIALYIAGTEIRVRSEDALLASRFGDEFQQYRRSVSAYIPFVR